MVVDDETFDYFGQEVLRNERYNATKSNSDNPNNLK